MASATLDLSTTAPARIGGSVQTDQWHYQGQDWSIAYETRGHRFAPAAFVTGGLDPAATREDFLKSLQTLEIPLMVVIGEQSPLSSKAEMEALAALPNVWSKRLPGSLGLHEEYAAEVAELVLPFLR
ncbi:MAG: hypothetical protein H7Z11_05950 [Verrucomicrobia bacterium]|nr:hypothetical protein [Leptolyngbya sp. ES-bin-22]